MPTKFLPLKFRDMYRVYYNERLSYVGTNADTIELYYGETPERLVGIDPNPIDKLTIDVSDLKLRWEDYDNGC